MKTYYPEEKYDQELLEEMDDIVKEDLRWVCPEYDNRYNCEHTAIKSKYGTREYVPSNSVDFNADIATRYYEDNKYARAYALTPYTNGVAIFCEKNNYGRDSFTIFMLGEDDGFWFISTVHNLEWITGKSEFMALLSEAISIFNNNFKDE